MSFISVDLGTTNIKVAAYDNDMRKLRHISHTVTYQRDNGFVEFDVEKYFEDFVATLAQLVSSGVVKADEVKNITLTGQAETLVVLDKNLHPLMNAISWMDDRSHNECKEVAKYVTLEECYAVTGQCAIIPTWPATKILWLKKNRPDIYAATEKYVLLKDYIAYKLTGQLFAECSIATFSFYFDIHKRCYWKKMLDIIGVQENQLPPLAEPGTDIGYLTDEVAKITGLHNTTVNIGTLDHFAGMIGTGNIKPGMISESTGTVLAMSIMAPLPLTGEETGALHYGPFPGTYVFLPACESGGVSLEWYRDKFLPGASFEDINKEIEKRGFPEELLFLPYLNGTNAPEFDAEATSVCLGLKTKHDAYDVAAAIMEGVALLLDKNIGGISTDPVCIISTGGGAKSPLWLQMKADVTGIRVDVPVDKEAALLGAAVMGAVVSDRFESYEEAVAKCVRMECSYYPRPYNQRKKEAFQIMYDAMIQAAKIMEA